LTLLFNVVLGLIARRAKIQTSWTKNPRSPTAVWEAYQALEKEAKKVGLKINESKTKHTIAAENSRAIRDKTFEVVNEFVYLDTKQRCESGDKEENPDCK
jgi:hypothetical protein